MKRLILLSFTLLTTMISWGETTAPADADLAASVSIAVGDFMGLVEKAAN